LRSTQSDPVAARQFIVDDEGGVTNALGHLIGQGLGIFDPFVIEFRSAKLRWDRVPFKKDNAFHWFELISWHDIQQRRIEFRRAIQGQ
jgi:hypothetical protein